MFIKKFVDFTRKKKKKWRLHDRNPNCRSLTKSIGPTKPRNIRKLDQLISLKNNLT